MGRKSQYIMDSKGRSQVYPGSQTVSFAAVEESVYLAELQIAASDVSPAMESQIRWIPGTDYGVLAVCLIPQDADPAWLPDVLSSLVAS